MEAREKLGLYPCLTALRISSHESYSASLQRILSLESCSKLRTLTFFGFHFEHVLELQEVVASYMRRTPCRYLENLTMAQKSCRHVHADDDGFGPIGGVISSGLATDLKGITASYPPTIEKPALENLSHMIEAGLLPNLKGLHLGISPTTAGSLTGWPNGVLVPLIDGFTLVPAFDRTPLLTFLTPSLLFLHALHRGAFPNLNLINISRFTEPELKRFISMLQIKGLQGAHTLRTVRVGTETSDDTLQQLRALLPAAEVRRE